MKTFIFSTLFSFLSFVLISQHTNAGFAKVAGLGEAKAFSSKEEAMVRFETALRSKKVNHIYTELASQAMVNAGQEYKEGEIFPADSIANFLQYVRENPSEASSFPWLEVYKLTPGQTYTFLTASESGSKVYVGKQLTRAANENEWALEVFDQMLMSSWCLNPFPSTGKIAKAPENRKPTFCPSPSKGSQKQPDLDYGRQVKKCPENPNGRLMYLVEAMGVYASDGWFVRQESSSKMPMWFTWAEIDEYRVQQGFAQWLPCKTGRVMQRWLEPIPASELKKAWREYYASQDISYTITLYD